jgi:hypothetical protein
LWRHFILSPCMSLDRIISNVQLGYACAKVPVYYLFSCFDVDDHHGNPCRNLCNHPHLTCQSLYLGPYTSFDQKANRAPGAHSLGHKRQFLPQRQGSSLLKWFAFFCFSIGTCPSIFGDYWERKGPSIMQVIKGRIAHKRKLEGTSQAGK